MRWLVRLLAPRDRRDEVLGDLAEARTSLEAWDLVFALARMRLDVFGRYRGSGTVQDYKLAFRMLLKYPGLTIAGGLALAIAIGLGAAWYDLTTQLFYPRIPLPEAERLVHVEVSNIVSGANETRLLNDLDTWRRGARGFEHLGAYRSMELSVIAPDTAPEHVLVAETTASMFPIAGVVPNLGRPLLEPDEQPGAPPVVVIGHALWQRQFGGRGNVLGRNVQLGQRTATIVGVMPEGFRFPERHSAWTAMERVSYGSSEGPAVIVFGRLAAGVTAQQARAELDGFITQEQLRPWVGPYGSPPLAQRTWFSLLLTHLPILLVLAVACGNVGTLMYARTATRDAEITMRYALGATRGRIIMQLFVEALALAAVAALAGLFAANYTLKWAIDIFTSGRPDALPFWFASGLQFPTMVFAAGLAIVSAAILGVLPALKATGANAQTQMRNLGSGGATLRFGKVWTSVMVGQVALTVIALPFVLEFAWETRRDLAIRRQFPAGKYVAALVKLRDEVSDASDSGAAVRMERTLAELERRLTEESGVASVTFASNLPGVGYDGGHAEIEAAPGAAAIDVPYLRRTVVGRRFLETFELPLLAGRDFHEGDRTPAAHTAIVNEAFGRRLLPGTNPVGRRVRYLESDPAKPGPWLEIVGVVGDIGMTPTSQGEAPYVFRPANPLAISPRLMAARVAGDPAALVPRIRSLAATVDAGGHLPYVEPLDALVWKDSLPTIVLAGSITGVFGLAIFLSAFGIYSLMSVSVARRTREIGLRTALGATPRRLLAHILRRALVVVGSGIAVGNGILVLFFAVYVLQVETLELRGIVNAVLLTSIVMFTVGLVACAEPARRALRIHPADALKDS